MELTHQECRELRSRVSSLELALRSARTRVESCELENEELRKQFEDDIQRQVNSTSTSLPLKFSELGLESRSLGERGTMIDSSVDALLEAEGTASAVRERQSSLLRQIEMLRSKCRQLEEENVRLQRAAVAAMHRVVLSGSSGDASVSEDQVNRSSTIVPNINMFAPSAPSTENGVSDPDRVWASLFENFRQQEASLRRELQQSQQKNRELAAALDTEKRSHTELVLEKERLFESRIRDLEDHGMSSVLEYIYNDKSTKKRRDPL